MTSTATLSGFRQSVQNFRNLHVSYHTAEVASSREIPAPGLFKWLRASTVFAPLESRHESSKQEDGQRQFFVEFRLREAYQNHFVLLRALFEFSRPKDIAVVTHNDTRSFEIRLQGERMSNLLPYLEIITDRLLKEIQFKASLKAIIHHEAKVKQEQLKLYHSLRMSLV